MDASASISIAYLVATLVIVTLIFILPRQCVIIPIIISVCYLNLEQKFIIAGFNIHLLRVLIMFGWIRLILRKEIEIPKFNYIDVTILCWVLISIITNTLLWLTWEAFINRVGMAYDVLGIYFFLRLVINDFEDVKRVLLYVSIIVVPLGCLMIYESLFGINIFSFLADSSVQVLERDGQFRCQGPFRHPILAGTFGATMLPLALPVYWQKNGKWISFAGGCSAAAIVVTSHSGGPLLVLIACVIGMCLWPLRRHLNIICLGTVIALLFLHYVMKAPVWYLYAKLSMLTGGTGWHRSYLIDQAIKYFDEWWFLGSTYTAHWMPYALREHPTQTDITNQFILEGVDGGLLKLILFVGIILCGFKMIRSILRNMDTQQKVRSDKIIPWSIGVSITAHIISFLSVAYFDQIWTMWYMAFAMLSAVYKSQIGECRT
jgi:hypothetical protein